MQDTLGDRMKRYEAVTKVLLPIRSYVIIRIDGCHFHTYTRDLKKPFDPELLFAMSEATRRTAEEIQGCKLAYVQSDEASFLLTDFDDLHTDAWFGNQLQKIVSVAASIFTAHFNALRITQGYSTLATFDARTFSLPDRVEVMNYFLWRIKDAERNSLAGLCQTYYSHKELIGKKASDQQELLFKKGINWNDFDAAQKRGTLSFREHVVQDGSLVGDGAWVSRAAPRDKDELLTFIPEKPF
jgi:tRNA(His) 5'-end guanylyltransferase